MAASAKGSGIDLGRHVMVPFAAGMLAFDLSRSSHHAAGALQWLGLAGVPFAFPLLGASSAGAGRLLAADLLVLVGVTWSVWSLRFPGRNLSVLAQARDVLDRGPCRWMRHPLLRALPGYRVYRARTAALLPGIF